MTARHSHPAGGLNVELDESNCVVIRRPALKSVDDVTVTVTDVEQLIEGLLICRGLQRLVDDGHEVAKPAPWPRDGVYRVSAGRWAVPSASEAPGAYWLVEEGYEHRDGRQRGGRFWTCGCPAGRTRGQMASTGPFRPPCRHVVAAQRAELKDGYPPRPGGRPNPSALVD